MATSTNSPPTTPTKSLSVASTQSEDSNGSPAKFVKPADLFRMRRRSSIRNYSSVSCDATPKNKFLTAAHLLSESPTSSNRSHQQANSIHPSPIKSSPSHSISNPPSTPKKPMTPIMTLDSQSPLKCLNNVTDPSPTKNLPTLLRNPFNQPVKRRILMFSPTKCNSSIRGARSPKKSRMIEPDEDANLEAPKFKQFGNQSPCQGLNKAANSCYQNDWTLRTTLRIIFKTQCKNWNNSINTTHRRILGKTIEESPSKLNDKTISSEAIKNVCTVYQHPYLAWLPLFPRTASEKKGVPFTLTRHLEATMMMHRDWCESLDDLHNLLVEGKCPYFYMCSDNYNILFKTTPAQKPNRPHVQACVSPFSFGMGCELNHLGIEFKCPGTDKSNLSNNSSIATKENSQTSFESSDQFSASSKQNQSKITNSIDSGNLSDFDDDDDPADQADHDASQILESLGLSQQDFPSLQERRKGFKTETEGSNQSKSTSSRPLALVEGVENIAKLITFLKTNRTYTINNVGKFSCIPPTLLSPREFRLSTPQCPEVVLSKNVMIEPEAIVSGTPGTPDRRPLLSASQARTPTKAEQLQTFNQVVGPTFIELRGTILPFLFDEVHNLLNFSDNSDHTCISAALDSSMPFRNIQFRQTCAGT